MGARLANLRAVKSVVGLDLRSLGLWRIGVGLVLLLDWLGRSFHLRAHYTDQGVLPLSAHLNQPDLSHRFWSVFYLNDSAEFVGLLFGLGALSSLALTLGYRTAWSGWIAWILLLGVQNRNPLVLTSGDKYLLLLLFWGNFLPWGRVFSLDASEPPDKDEPGVPVVCFPAVGYLAQVCLLYWFTALLRVGPTWQVDASALYMAYNLEPLVKEPGYAVLGLGPDWLALFTRTALAMELFGPFLLLLPGAWVRMLAVALIIVFHLGILATLEVYNFPLICMVAPLGLLPPRFWQFAAGRWLLHGLGKAQGALHRRLPGALATLSPPSPGRSLARLRVVAPPMALLAICVYLWLDLKGLHENSPFMATVRAAGISQNWGMFSPNPPAVHGYHSVRARLRSGVELDLISERPYPEQGEYRGRGGWIDQRWGIFRSMIQMTVGFEGLAAVYLSYLVTEWDRLHPDDPVVQADYLWHSRRIPPDYLLHRYVPEVKAQIRR